MTTGEDCVSERVRFDDNVSFIAPHNFESNYAEKISIDSSCSFRGRCLTKHSLTRSDKAYDSLSNDSIYVDITLPSYDDKPRKALSTTATLRSLFFHSTLNDSKPIAKSLDDKVIIEVSNEAFLLN